MLLLVISFIAGILTILAPCVLPVLPIIIGGSVGASAKDRTRPYIIGAALAGSIVCFTLLLKASTVLVNLSPSILTDASGSLIILLGFVSVWPEAWEWLVIKLNWQATSQRLLGRSERRTERYVGPILIGVSLGPVFASCSPTYAFILASVLPHSFVSGLVYLAAYSLGLVLMLLLVSLLGRQYVSRFSWAVDTHSWFRRIVGLLFIATGLVIITGHEVSVETWVANHLPFDETKIERILLAKQTKSSVLSRLTNDSVLNVQPTPAPEFAGLTNWINSKPLTVHQLRGKVVLVDFWTYSCINCIRSIPYVEKWYQTYEREGLVVVGVNTPEFAFEHNPGNVAAAVKADKITYPVALDNNYDTWNAYSNDSWPADYLIDRQGDIRYVSLGEGDYSQTERAIQSLLGVSQTLTTPTSSVPISADQTPETYFGTNRAQNYTGAPDLNDGTYSFTPNSNLQSDEWTLGGKWQISGEDITSQSADSTLHFNVTAKDVYVVATSNDDLPRTVAVSLPSPNVGQYGIDAPNGLATVGASRLYHIVSLAGAGTTMVTLKVPTGVSLYTFTFGS
ncbi:MAG TPA: cytochrome c biogenesis protein DipZ [Verrucomicrobiae bacterium]|nr:cytochrome c biogenesis protein DipZ [Verrucomicrobiae bacterium]